MRPLILAALLAASLDASQAPPQKFVPDLIQASDLVVRLDPAGTLPSHQNPTSPVVAGSTLFAAGDNGDSYEDGLTNGQDPALEHTGAFYRLTELK